MRAVGPFPTTPEGYTGSVGDGTPRDRRPRVGSEVHDPVHDGHGDVGDRAEAVAVGQDLLREGDEGRSFGEQEADRVDQVVGPDVCGVGLVEVEERVAPDHDDEGVLELELRETPELACYEAR